MPTITGQLPAGAKIYPDVRPDSRKNKADIVINVLGPTNNVLQVGTGNVNIYWPSITETVDGAQWTKPDHFNLGRMAKLVTPFLESQWRDSFHTEVETPPVLLRDTDGSYFINIRVKYYSLQSNYQNI